MVLGESQEIEWEKHLVSAAGREMVVYRPSDTEYDDMPALIDDDDIPDPRWKHMSRKISAYMSIFFACDSLFALKKARRYDRRETYIGERVERLWAGEPYRNFDYLDLGLSQALAGYHISYDVCCHFKKHPSPPRHQLPLLATPQLPLLLGRMSDDTLDPAFEENIGLKRRRVGDDKEPAAKCRVKADDDEHTAADTLLEMAAQWASDTTLGSDAPSRSSTPSLAKIAEGGGPPSLTVTEVVSQIAEESEGPAEDAAAAADRLCKTCCYDMHICLPAHLLEEYTTEWTACTLEESALHERHPINCGSCGTVVGAVGSRKPEVSTLVCCQCKDGMRCQSCCIDDHAALPLHEVKMWNGRYWEEFRLQDIGYVYDMGHEGRACGRPAEVISSLLVIDIWGCHSIRRRFRSSRFIDTHVGVEGKDPASSQIIGDCGIFISDDGERVTEHLLNPTHKKRRTRLNPDALDDALAKWIPVAEGDCDLSDTTRLDSVSGGSTESKKRKAYSSSDNLMSEFPAVQQSLLEETLWMHGLGHSYRSQKCVLCQESVGPTAKGEGQRHFFRCGDCGTFLQCQECCLKRHALTLLHFLEEWGGGCWTRTTLAELGLVYQLGHEGGRCKFPHPFIRSLTMIETSGIHEIKYRFCACRRSDHSSNLKQFLRNGWYPASFTDPDTCATFKSLDLFRLLNVVTNINARDFITTLERLTDATSKTGLKWIPDRYKGFLRMARQWAFLQRLRRSAHCYDPRGIVATTKGECIPKCWTCPAYDFLPIGPSAEGLTDIYFRLILAMDTNFKMKNRIRAREHNDPSLGPGWGAFVELKAYQKHLKKYMAEKDISTCIAFAALTQKDTRNTAGLRVSGVGGCVCAWHECMRPNGLGDLQKGERYANMDYILTSAVAGFDGKQLTLSYDIACQWKRNLAERMKRLPKELQLDLDAIDIDTGLPVWHALAHEDICATVNSLNYIPGVGRTDGEGVERLWAWLNACSYATKEMGLGNRADTVKDKLDAHNFLKNIGQADALRRKLIVAIAERARQVASFKEINKSIPAEKHAEWQKQIDAFIEDRSCTSPYTHANTSGPTEAEIRATLKKKEQEEAKGGCAPLHATSATAFLLAGLQLEEIQRRIRAQLALPRLTADRESKIHEFCIAFMAKLQKFRELQVAYTPGAVWSLEAEERQWEAAIPAPSAEAIRLWLPSELPEAERTGSGCQRNVVEMEVALHEGQCSNALVVIRIFCIVNTI
ncbi:hypothetical protein C8R46DRAFT_1220409 [Mycena filopes]|nr:hypothetical protein C8R46DRAFT_1220409 [Mycena filopes]